MIYHGKEVEVIMVGDAKDFYEYLSNKVAQEILKGITSSKNQTLLHVIKRKIELLKSNPSYGIQISKDKIPKIYRIEYNANNLWKINLTGFWRIIYTINGNEVKIMALILDIFDHKDYEKKFHYNN